MLNARNVEDDKAIQWALESFNFKGLKELLGEAPGTASAETAATKLFHQRLDAIKHVVLDRLTWRGDLSSSQKFATEFRSLKAAEREIGEYLKLYQDCGIPRSSKLCSPCHCAIPLTSLSLSPKVLSRSKCLDKRLVLIWTCKLTWQALQETNFTEEVQKMASKQPITFRRCWKRSRQGIQGDCDDECVLV